jgi:hypothetical protein
MNDQYTGYKKATEVENISQHHHINEMQHYIITYIYRDMELLLYPKSESKNEKKQRYKLRVKLTGIQFQ